MKVGIIRCQLTEDMCPGNTDFKVAQEGVLGFAEIGPAEVVGYLSCGGCPGKKAVTRAKMMVERGGGGDRVRLLHEERQPHRLPLPAFRDYQGCGREKTGTGYADHRLDPLRSRERV